jgi:DNA-binding XRE family transcriptional regulator
MKTHDERTRAMREARLRLRMTQLELSRLAGCSESQITKIETGRVQPAQWLKEVISKVLGIKTWEVGV